MERPLSMRFEVWRLNPDPARTVVEILPTRGVTAAERTAAPLKDDFLAKPALIEATVGKWARNGRGTGQ